MMNTVRSDITYRVILNNVDLNKIPTINIPFIINILGTNQIPTQIHHITDRDVGLEIPRPQGMIQRSDVSWVAIVVEQVLVGRIQNNRLQQNETWQSRTEESLFCRFYQARSS